MHFTLKAFAARAVRRTSTALALACLAVITALTAETALTDPQTVAARTEVRRFASELLSEERELFVRLPPSYADGAASYPVVYVLDGEWNFDLVASYLDYFADNRLFPEMIVAGIRNVNRNRDYVPRPDPNFPYTGGGEAFYAFLDREWIPYMQAHYRTSGERVLVGHSFGGVATLHAFFQQPERFDGYIALGTSAWIADRVLFEEAERLFAAGGSPSTFVFMAVGEDDGGPTRPDSEALAELFAQKAPQSLEWAFRVTPRTEHFTNFVSGLHEGFQAFFPRWEFADEMGAAGRQGGAQAVDAWFAGKEADLGFRFQPAWFDLSIEAFALARGGHEEAALAVMRQLVARYPDDPSIASFSGRVFEISGEFAAAEREFLRAIALTKESGAHPNEIQLPRLEANLARVRARTAQ